MKVKILRNTRASGKMLERGKTVDLKEKDAKTLIRLGKAEDPSGKKKKAETLTTENAGGLVGDK